MPEQIDIVKEISEITDPKALRVIKYLLEEIKQLKEKVARLEKNSSNSSKPPSSDITKPENEQRQPGKRKSGGQSRHGSNQRVKLKPDKVENLELKTCPDCGHDLCDSEKKQDIIQQTIELKEKPVEITEYRRQGCKCENCGSTNYAALPDGVLENHLCGPRLQALLVYMKGNQGASYTELEQFCQDVLGVRVSRAAICDIVKRGSEALKEPYDELSVNLSQEKLLNIDESGWRDCGSQYWVWLFCTNLIAFFSIQKSRGSKVLKEILGEAFQGGIISDFYSAYVSLASENQQFCLAHLIRDIKFLTTLPDNDTQVFSEKILDYFRRLFMLWHNRENMTQMQLIKSSNKIKRKLFTYLIQSSIEQSDATKIKKRIVKRWDSLFRFIDNPDIFEPTNNLAERTLRPLVRVRRQTQGTRSEWGRMWCSRILSVICTCKKQKRSAFNFILDSINAKYFNSNFPSLLPTYTA
jgi:transposase